MRCVIIGLGGLGTHLVPTLFQFLNYENQKKLFNEIVLLDGDTYEEKNKSRQIFDGFGNKAEVIANYYANLYNLPITYDGEYVTKKNIKLYIKEGDLVLTGVDNNASRFLFEQHLLTLKNCTIISGGNNLTDGNVTVTQIKNGKLTTPLLTKLHPEIATPKDKNPGELGCEALAALPGGAQIGLVNHSVANTMLTVFFSMVNKKLEYYEVFVDCLTAATRAVGPEGADPLKPEYLTL